MKIIHLNIKISGLVQGVSFRFYTKQTADQMGIFGFIQNLTDGSVYTEAEGSEHSLEKFVKWCHHGPAAARVSNVEVTKDKIKNFTSFEISYEPTK